MPTEERSTAAHEPARHRRLVWVADEVTALQTALKAWPMPQRTLWLDSGGDSPLQPPPGVQCVGPNQAQHVLGSEWSGLLVDGYSGLDPDMLLALAGTLRPGSVCALLTPPDWEHRPNAALTRWLSAGQTLPQGSRLAQWLSQVWQPCKRSVEQLSAIPSVNEAVAPVELTTDQQAVLAALPTLDATQVWWIRGRRGRGKSTLLAELVQRTVAQQVVMVSNHSAALATFFARLEAQGWRKTGRNTWQRAGLEAKKNAACKKSGTPLVTLRLMAPDALLARSPRCDLLLIDEAARLTLPVLTRLLQIPVPMVLASTDEGYEGAGQGLRLKLAARLPAGKTLRTFELHTPIRWAADDPLEKALDAAFLLDASLPPAPRSGDVVIKPWAREAVTFLPALWPLLRTAHYQTRPRDLLQLLDAPGQQLWLAYRRGEVVGAVWALEEGGLQVPVGHVRGHLVAQRLAQVTGAFTWLTQRSLRITRIAVHPDLQRQGVGTRLVQAVMQQPVDFVSVSCAAEPSLLHFWTHQGFRVLHTGTKPNRASGVPSAILIWNR